VTQQKKLPYQNSLITPVFQTATYYFKNTSEVEQYHDGSVKIGRYGRYDNPTWLDVEVRLADLEAADSALIFPSGMSAITSTLLCFLGPKKKLAYTSNGYRNVRTLCSDFLGRLGVDIIPLNLLDQPSFKSRVEEIGSEGLDAIFLETPSNPHLMLADIEFVREAVGPETLIIVDSTFATPVNFRPLTFGADLVIHSASKYLSGQADIVMGCVAGRSDLIEKIRIYRNVTGAICDPHAAFLLGRSLDTLEIRMRHLNSQGLELATFLEGQRNISKVFYTGLPSHPQFGLAKKCLTGHGGVVSFEVDASKEAVSAFIDRLTIPFMGTNFGSGHSMVEQCSVFTYHKQSKNERAELGISDRLVRYAVGFDNILAVKEDIGNALYLL
jgi:cystathionine gamma-synthase